MLHLVDFYARADLALLLSRQAQGVQYALEVSTFPTDLARRMAGRGGALARASFLGQNILRLRVTVYGVTVTALNARIP